MLIMAELHSAFLTCGRAHGDTHIGTKLAFADGILFGRAE
jgi:hypothetical protein